MADQRHRDGGDAGSRERMEQEHVRGRAERDDEFDDDTEVVDDEEDVDEDEEDATF